MPRVDLCNITTSYEIGSFDRRRPLHTGPYLDPARVLFPDHAEVMERRGRRIAKGPSTSTVSLAPLSLARATSAPVDFANAPFLARPPPSQRAQTESHRRTTSESPAVDTTRIPLVVGGAPSPSPTRTHGRTHTADSSAWSTLSARSTATMTASPTPQKPYHNVYHSYHRRNSSATTFVTLGGASTTTHATAVSGSTRASASSRSAVVHASLLGTRPRRTLFHEETVVLTLHGYVARESKQTVTPMTRSESVVCGATGHNSLSMSAQEYRRQARYKKRQARRGYDLEFIPKPSLWQGEKTYYRRQACTWRYQWTKRGRAHLAMLYPTPDLVRDPQGALC